VTAIPFDDTFGASYEIELLDSEPANALILKRQGSLRSGGVVVEVSAPDGGSWVCVARPGPPTVRGAMSGAFSTPSPTKLLVVARGDGYLVDVAAPDRYEELETGGPVCAVRSAVADQLLLLASCCVLPGW
jgi:hypothetical protein